MKHPQTLLNVHSTQAVEDEELGPDGKKLCPCITSSIISELTNCNSALSQQRKKRQIPATLASVDALERYIQISSHPFHKMSKPSILSVNILYSKDQVTVERILRVIFIGPEQPSPALEKLKRQLVEADAALEARKKPPAETCPHVVGEGLVIDEWKERREKYLARQQVEVVDSV